LLRYQGGVVVPLPFFFSLLLRLDSNLDTGSQVALPGPESLKAEFQSPSFVRAVLVAEASSFFFLPEEGVGCKGAGTYYASILVIQFSSNGPAPAVRIFSSHLLMSGQHGEGFSATM